MVRWLKQKKKLDSLDDLDPELKKTFDKLGISLNEQKRLPDWKWQRASYLFNCFLKIRAMIPQSTLKGGEGMFVHSIQKDFESQANGTKITKIVIWNRI